LSYGVYIVGWPISQTLVWLSPGIGTVHLVATSIVLALGLAALSWHLIEKPSLRARGTFERLLCG
jgi:peptidoglycan/LPS O-acetylase OafA/YrhL